MGKTKNEIKEILNGKENDIIYEPLSDEQQAEFEKVNEENSFLFKKEQLNIIKYSFLMLIFSVIIISLFFRSKENILGLILGYVMSLLNYRLLYLTLLRATHMTPHKAKRYTILQYLARYMLLGCVAAGVVINKNFNIFTFLAGLLLLKVVLYLENFKYSKNMKKVTYKKTIIGGEENGNKHS